MLTVPEHPFNLMAKVYREIFAPFTMKRFIADTCGRLLPQFGIFNGI
jgi:hypothetical protein